MPTDTLSGIGRHAWIALCITLALIGAVTIWGLSNDSVPPAILIALHLGSTSLIGLVALATAGRSVALQLTLWTLSAGAFGAFVWMIALAAAGGQTSPRTAFPQWLDDQIQDERGGRLISLQASIRDNRVRLSGAHGIQALVDTFAGDCTSAKLNALAVLARDYDKQMAPALTLALRSHDAAVRVLGAGVLARLQQRHSDIITRLLARVEHQPRSPEAWRSLAAAHMTFADSGLLVGERRLEAIGRAQHAEESAQALEPAARNALAFAARSQSPREHLFRASA